MKPLTSSDFKIISRHQETQSIYRPSLSYWSDAWIRLRANKRAFFSLYLIIGLLVFTILGPVLWSVDPSLQELEQVSQPPGTSRLATKDNEYEP